MKTRILTGWTFTRGLYLVTGSFLIIQFALQEQWFGVLFGGYFAAMGLFAFGCAAGNCLGGNCLTEPQQKSGTSIQDVQFEEEKTK